MAGNLLGRFRVGLWVAPPRANINSGSLATSWNSFVNNSGVDPGTNQIFSSNASGAVAAFANDASGDVTYDGNDSYLYDGEGRIWRCPGRSLAPL